MILFEKFNINSSAFSATIKSKSFSNFEDIDSYKSMFFFWEINFERINISQTAGAGLLSTIGSFTNGVPLISVDYFLPSPPSATFATSGVVEFKNFRKQGERKFMCATFFENTGFPNPIVPRTGGATLLGIDWDKANSVEMFFSNYIVTGTADIWFDK